jgi:hypothetical protein
MNCFETFSQKFVHSKALLSTLRMEFVSTRFKERLPALARDLLTFSSKAIKSFIIEEHFNVKREKRRRK